MTALETAFLSKLIDPERTPDPYRPGEGQKVIRTALPADGDWTPDGELIADARWWAEQPTTKEA